MLSDMSRLKASKEKAVVTAEINTLPSQTAFGALMAGWEKLPPEVLNRGLRTVVRAVVVKKHEQKWHRGTVRVVGQWEPDLQLVRPTG